MEQRRRLHQLEPRACRPRPSHRCRQVSATIPAAWTASTGSGHSPYRQNDRFFHHRRNTGPYTGRIRAGDRMVSVLAHGGRAPYRPETITRTVHRNQGYNFLGLSYADLGLLGPNDLRIARANRWTSTIVINGAPTWMEIRGPSDPEAYTACWNVLQTGWTMASAVWPPRMQKYHDMVRECCRRYPSTYALAYQQCDRYRKEMVPEI